MAKTRLQKKGPLQRLLWPTPRACMGTVTQRSTRDFNLEDFVAAWEDEYEQAEDSRTAGSEETVQPKVVGEQDAGTKGRPLQKHQGLARVAREPEGKKETGTGVLP